MRPPPWNPPVDPSPAEQTVMRLVKRAKLFVFLRQQRHVLFDNAFQAELAAIYKDSPFGQPPVPPPSWPLPPSCKRIRASRTMKSSRQA